MTQDTLFNLAAPDSSKREADSSATFCSPLRVLIACESSGVVRDAFSRLGHDATSCDLLPTESPGDHFMGDVREILFDSDQHWDLIIAHPPCTFLNVAAAWAFEDPDFEKYPGVGYHQKVKAGTLTGKARRDAQKESLDFVRMFMDFDCPRIAIENPVGAISSKIRKADQYVQPYEYGDDASKKTGLWLKGLPKLQPTHYVEPRIVNGKKRWANQTDSGQNNLSPGADRWKERSKTYQGIADAMALQWGGDTGWRKVCFAMDVCEWDEETEELSDDCKVCGLSYCDSPCPGPTEDGWEYEERPTGMWARRVSEENA